MLEIKIARLWWACLIAIAVKNQPLIRVVFLYLKGGDMLKKIFKFPATNLETLF